MHVFLAFGIHPTLCRDYFASFMIGGNNVMIHRMSRRTSQLIFRDQKFPIQSAMFHPYRPFMLICTRTCVYLYDLNEQSLIKKLSSGNQTLSCMAVHPGGDNLIIGTDLGRLAWYDSGNETMHLPLHHLSFTFDD